MSSSGSPSNEARTSAADSTVWHPAQEWLDEDDELDMDYHPAIEGSEDDDGWEMDAEEMGLELGISEGKRDQLLMAMVVGRSF